MGNSVCARINRIMPVVDGVCNVVGNQLVMCFVANFCGVLSLTFVAFCFKFLRCLVGFIKASRVGCLVV